MDAIEVRSAYLSVFEELKNQLDLKRLVPEAAEPSADQLTQLAEDKNVVALTRQLLLVALRERASDIHLEPAAQGLRVRLRIDGELREWQQLDRSLLAPVVSRLKLLAGCDIAERRRPPRRAHRPRARHPFD